jgi:hypothetical protein
MLARDPDLVRRADAVREPIDAIFEAAALPELKEHETRSQELGRVPLIMGRAR